MDSRGARRLAHAAIERVYAIRLSAAIYPVAGLAL